jgi:hypothetical protein
MLDDEANAPDAFAGISINERHGGAMDDMGQVWVAAHGKPRVPYLIWGVIRPLAGISIVTADAAREARVGKDPMALLEPLQ